MCRVHGITEHTYYRWNAKYGGMELGELQQLKQVEDENRRLKQIVAEQTLEIQALKAAVVVEILDPVAQRDAVGWLRTRGASLQRACRVVGLNAVTW